MGKWIHRLSNINLELMQADCANCGRTKITIKDQRPKCWIGRSEQCTTLPVYRIDKQFPVGIIGECAICLSTAKLNRDHDHSCCDVVVTKSCGECIRGYICTPCNRALGLFKDDKDILQRAINFLQT